MKLNSLFVLVLGLFWMNLGVAEVVQPENISNANVSAVTPLNPIHHNYHPHHPHYPKYPHYPQYPQYPQYPHYPQYPQYGNSCSTYGGVCPIAPGPIGVSCWCAFWNGTFWGNVTY